MRYYSIGEFAKAIGKTTKTLRNWDKNGKLKPARIEDTRTSESFFGLKIRKANK